MVVFSVPEDAKFNGRVVYKFTSPVDKGYIGKSVNFKSRMSGHRSEAYYKKDGDWVKKTKWKEAIREFGWDNLRVEILERVPEKVSLEERERYWIARLNTVFPNGYNMNEGGGGVIKHTAEAKAKNRAAHIGIGAKPVTSREIKEEYADGTQLVEFVCYASATEAEKKTKIGQTGIAKCCNKKKKSAGGRFWHFTKDDDLVGEHHVPSIGDVPRVGHSSHKRAVFSTSPGGKKQQHEGSRAAGRTLSKSTGKKFGPGAISMCCNGKQTHHHGYKFWYATPELIAQFKKQASKKRKRE